MWSRRMTRRRLIGLSAFSAGVFGVCGKLYFSPALISTVRAEGLPYSSASFDVTWLAAGRGSGVILTDDRIVPSGPGSGSLDTPVVRAPMAFTALAVHWQQPTSGEVSVAIRLSADGVVWTDWQPVQVDDAQKGDAGSEVYGVICGTFDTAQWYAQVHLELVGSPSSEPSISQITFVFIDARVGPNTADALARAGITAEALDGIQNASKPPIINRTAWGCPDGQSSPQWPAEYHTVTNVIVHHTATSNAASDWAAVVRAIWAYHTYDRAWGDVGYNFLVDPNGYIYEGKAGGDDVIAGHTYGFNTGTLGIALLGTFGTASPTAAAITSAQRLIAWKAYQRGFDPTASNAFLAYQSCVAQTLTIPRLLGHRDAPGHGSYNACNTYGTTECPGDALWKMLPAMRAASKALIPVAPGVAFNAVSTTRTWFVLSWVGSGGSGSLTFKVEQSADGATWQTWLAATSASKALYLGQANQKYYFRVWATDAVGSVSQPAQVAIQTGGDSAGLSRAALGSVTKNH